MDEIDQYKAFASLVKQGQSAEEIASQLASQNGLSPKGYTKRGGIEAMVGWNAVKKNYG